MADTDQSSTEERRHQFRVIVVMSFHSAFVDINGGRFIIQIVELEGDHFKGNSVAGEGKRESLGRKHVVVGKASMWKEKRKIKSEG